MTLRAYLALLDLAAALRRDGLWRWAMRRAAERCGAAVDDGPIREDA